MKRRGLMALLGVATVSLPRATLAQQSCRIGLLSAGAPLTAASAGGASILRSIAKSGYILGKNLALEVRGASGHVDRLKGLVQELVRAKVDLIVTAGYPAALAAKEGTTLPVVANNAGDPVATGLVESLARPGGNLTGISDVSAELTPKRLEFLKLMAPTLQRVAILWNADDLGMTMRSRASEAGAKELGISVQQLGVREPDDFGDAFRAMDAVKPDAILMVTDSLTFLNRKRVFEYAVARRLPAIYEFDYLVREGGLMSYGPDSDESSDRVAALADRILKGNKPAELPFEQPTRFKFAVNVKAAKEIGLDPPSSLLAAADEVIE
jgi:putative ABC transport system substrate-binding protein